MNFSKIFSLIYNSEQSNFKKKNIIYAVSLLSFILMSLSIYFRATKPNAVVQKTHSKIDISSYSVDQGIDKDIESLLSKTNKTKANNPKVSQKISEEVKKKQTTQYKAKQVINRGDEFDSNRGLPTGFEVTGKLLTGIDTREPSAVYKILLPYGASFRGGKQIPYNTTLLAAAKQSDKNSKVYLTISGGVLPDGREFKVSGQALDPATRQPGIEGSFHSKAGARITQTLGLEAVSAAAEILVEREQIGKNESGIVAARSTWKNAGLKGLSKASQLESSRQE